MLQIQLQALKFSNDASFKASNGWVQRFMRRYGLALRQKTKIAQKLPDDLEEKVTSGLVLSAEVGKLWPAGQMWPTKRFLWPTERFLWPTARPRTQSTLLDFIR